MSKKQFLSEFLKERKTVGSITPSSRFLIKKMLDPVDFSVAKHILELGPGNGCITEEILKRAGSDTQVYTLEMNEVFCDALEEIGDDRLHIYNESAENIGACLAKHNITEVDAIVSSLPFKVIPDDIEEKIMEEVVKHLKDGGVYTQYHYTRNGKKYKKWFNKVDTDFAALNVPPAFVYQCTK